MDGAFSFTFIKNEVVGFKAAPAIFETTTYIDQDVHLNKGWTWISLYTEDPNLGDLNALTEGMNMMDHDIIKGQTYFDVYDTRTGWSGSLSSTGGLNTTTMYKVKVSESNVLQLGGNEVDIGQWSVPLSTGWNWLGYPLSNNVSINEALALLDAVEGDVIKNQRAFAIYDPVVGWTGTLRYLFAGEGYMLKTGMSQQFSYPDIFRSSKAGRTAESQPFSMRGWEMFEHNMSIVAEVDPSLAYDSIWVMNIKGELRGKASVERTGTKTIGYITIYGNAKEQEELRFYLGSNSPSDIAAEKLVFTPDEVLGTRQDPYQLNVSETQPSLYPNTFTKGFRLEFHATQPQTMVLSMTDAIGHEILRKTFSVNIGFNSQTIEPEIPEGMYVVTFTVDGKKFTRKVVKK
jgi:hypothetical protein